MPTVSSYGDLSALVPFIQDRTYDRCRETPSVERSYSDLIELCTSSNCVKIYYSWGYIYLRDGRSGNTAYIGNYSLDDALDYIAAILCS